jgi:WD40 repeat protein
MRPLLPCLLLLALVAPARAQDDEPPDEGDPNARVFLTVDPGHHVGPIRALRFTPDGTRLISAGEDRTIQVWSAASGERLRVFHPPVSTDRGGVVLAAALAPDGKTLACATRGVTFDGGKHTGHFLYLLNLDDGRILPLETADLLSHDVAFSPDGNRLAVVHGRAVHVYGGLKDVWDRRDVRPRQEKILRLGPTTRPQVAFSPDGSRLAAGQTGDRTIGIWDLGARGRNPAPVATCRGSFGLLLSLAWTPDGQRLLSGHFAPANDPAAPALCVWSAAGKELKSFTVADLDRAVGTTGGHGFRRVDQVFCLPGGGELLLVARGTSGPGRLAALFDPESGRGRQLLHDPGYAFTFASTAALAPDGRLAALAVAPDGRRIALLGLGADAGVRYLAGAGGTSRQVGWARDPAGHALIWKAPDQAPAGLDLRRLERLVAPPPPPEAVTQRDGWTLQRSATPGEHVLYLSHNGQVVKVPAHALSFTLPAAGDVTWVAWTAQLGLHLSDAATGNPLRQFRPRGTLMTSVASSPDGKYLVAHSARGLYHVYRPDQAEPLLTLFVSGPDWVVWTEQGYYAATPGGEKLVGWTVNNGPGRLATFYPAERFHRRLYRPDVIGLVLEKGSVTEALRAVNATATNVEELLPPKSALEIVDASKPPRVKVKATAEAAVKGQPVTALRLFVDGRPLADATEGKGLKEWPQGVARAEAEWEVTLSPGEHELAVLARSPDAAAASDAVPVRLTVRDVSRPALHLLAVGINDYQNKDLHLDFAATDAREVAAAFRKHCAGPGNLFGAVDGEPLLNDKATRAAVLQSLRNLRRGVKPGDLAVVYFAGHGVKDGNDFYLLTVDADTSQLAQTAVAGKELRQALADIPCQVLLILDACHAAAGVKAFRPATDDAARALTDDDCAVAVFCAAMGAEYAQEAKGNGLFTKALIEALSRSERVPYNYGDGRQYVHHLHTFVFDEVQRLSQDQQHPFLNLPWVTPSFPVRRLPQAPQAAR